MKKSALIVIDIQKDITKNYKEIIDNLNKAIDWAVDNEIPVIYIRHENLSPKARLFKPGTEGTELASDLKVVTENIFMKSKSNALTSEGLVAFINDNDIQEFYVTGADATICVKSSVFNLNKSGYKVNVLSDCIASYDKKKIPEMIAYYINKGSHIITTKNL